MASRSKTRRGSARSTGDQAAQAMRDSAQKIWLAGLGAFERAKSEGPRMFEALVAQGKDLSERARGAADQALKQVREQAGEAQGKWDKLEQVFEARVSKSLNRLGVLTSKEVEDLSRQVQELNATVSGLMRKRAKAPAKAKRAGAGPKGAARGAKKKRPARKASKP